MGSQTVREIGNYREVELICDVNAKNERRIYRHVIKNLGEDTINKNSIPNQYM